MFEKISRLAEQAATSVSVSRRGFLGRLGQAALGAAGALGGLLLLPGAARAGSGVVCCTYYFSKNCYGTVGLKSGLHSYCFPAGTTCSPVYTVVGGTCTGQLKKSATVADCTKC